MHSLCLWALGRYSCQPEVIYCSNLSCQSLVWGRVEVKWPVQKSVYLNPYLFDELFVLMAVCDSSCLSGMCQWVMRDPRRAPRTWMSGAAIAVGTSMSVHGSDTTRNCTSLGTSLTFPLTSSPNSLLDAAFFSMRIQQNAFSLEWLVPLSSPRLALHGQKLLSVSWGQIGTWGCGETVGARPCWRPCSSK